MEADDASQFFDDKLTGSSAASDETETDVVSVLVRRHDGRDQSVGSSVLVDVGRVDALGEFRLLVVLVLGVNADGGRSGFGRFALILGRHGEFVVGVVIVGVQLLGVANNSAGIDGEVVVRHRVFDFGIGAGIRVGRFHFQDGRSYGDVFVDVVGLVVGQFELGHVVVDVRHANRQLATKNRKFSLLVVWKSLLRTDLYGCGETAGIFGGRHLKLVDVRLT